MDGPTWWRPTAGEADTRTLSIKTDVSYSVHYKQTYKDVKEITDIYLEEIVVCIKKCYQDDKEDSSLLTI